MYDKNKTGKINITTLLAQSIIMLKKKKQFNNRNTYIMIIMEINMIAKK